MGAALLFCLLVRRKRKKCETLGQKIVDFYRTGVVSYLSNQLRRGTRFSPDGTKPIGFDVEKQGGLCHSFFMVRIIYRRCFSISKESLRINEEIHIREVRVTSAEGEQLGIMLTRDALHMAEEQHLDLVEVAPKAKPPVCRIMDFGKYRYEQQKRDKEAKKKQKVVMIKEVKLRPNIEQHDFEVKLKNALRFVEEGNKVKVTIMFRGREMSHQDLGRDVLNRVAAEMKDLVSIERDAKLEGKNMIMILAPKAQTTKGGK